MRVEDVGRGGVTLLADRRRQLGRLAEAHVELDAGVLRELRVERLDELLLAAGVDDQLVPVGAAAGCCHERDRAEQNRQEKQGGRPAEAAHG